MDRRLMVLKLVLDELGVPGNVDSLSDRKLLQKAVYLGQAAGVDLSYRYNWYLRGPYSPSLTRDYFRLDEEIATGSRDFEGKQLHSSLREELHRVRAIFNVPGDVDLGQADWLELLASTHFLKHIRGLKEDEIRERIREEKPHLVDYLDEAEREMEQVSLL